MSMRLTDVIVTKVWWSKKFALKWRPDWAGFWRTAQLFETLQEAKDAREEFLSANGI